MADSLTASLLNTISANNSLAALFANSNSFGNPFSLAQTAQAVLDFKNQFPREQALALSGLFMQVTALNESTTPLVTSAAANTFLVETNSPVLPTSAYTQRTTSSSDSSVVTATASAGATATSYDVGVSQLAVAQVDTSSSVTSTTTNAAGLNINAGSNTLGVSINGAQAKASYYIYGTMTNEDALTALASAINTVTANNDIQTVTLSGATSGNFSLTFNGKTTGNLSYNSSAATVQTALEGLSTVGAGNVNVTLSGGTYTIAFTGTLANQPLAKVQVNNNSLNSGASISTALIGPTASVTTSGGNSTLTVTGGTVGTSGAFTLTDVAGNGLTQVFGAATISTSGTGVTTTAQDAYYTLNGATYQVTNSNSATIDNGNLALSFLAASSDTSTVTVSSDTSSLITLVTNLATAYNNLQTYLSDNSSLLSSSLATQATAIITANAAALSKIGITGTTSLAVDTTTLDSATSDSIDTAISSLQGVATQLSQYSQTVLGNLQGLFASQQPQEDNNSVSANGLAAQFSDVLVGQSLGQILNVKA